MALITLTSDIGRQDFLTGAVKGQLLQINPEFNIVDISHELSPFNYPQAAYVCRNAIKNFPPQTFHIVLVNLFDKRPDIYYLSNIKDQYIGCADNGLITMILEETPEKIVALPLIHPNKKTLCIAPTFLQKPIKIFLMEKQLKNVAIQRFHRSKKSFAAFAWCKIY